MPKLYCYVDETGQDTRGAFFLVVVLLLPQEVSLPWKGDWRASSRRAASVRSNGTKPGPSDEKRTSAVSWT